MKKLLCLVIAVVLTLSIAITSFAAVTINYTFKATDENGDEWVYFAGTFDEGDTEVGLSVDGKDYKLEPEQYTQSKNYGNNHFIIGLADRNNLFGGIYDVTPYAVNAEGREEAEVISVNETEMSVKSDASLGTISSEIGTIYPEFNSETTEYYLYNEENNITLSEDSVSVTPVDENATVTKSVEDNILTVLVENGEETKTYTVTLVELKQATLSISKNTVKTNTLDDYTVDTSMAVKDVKTFKTMLEDYGGSTSELNIMMDTSNLPESFVSTDVKLNLYSRHACDCAGKGESAILNVDIFKCLYDWTQGTSYEGLFEKGNKVTTTPIAVSYLNNGIAMTKVGSLNRYENIELNASEFTKKSDFNLTFRVIWDNCQDYLYVHTGLDGSNNPSLTIDVTYFEPVE